MTTRLKGAAGLVIGAAAVVWLMAPAWAWAQSSQPESGSPVAVSAVPTTQEAAPAGGAAGQGHDWFYGTKHPAEWMSWGADQRIRWEYYNNVYTLNNNLPGNERDYFRFRSRLWSTFTPTDMGGKQPADKFGMDINARLAWEWREYLNPNQINPSANHNFMDTDLDEVIFDTLNVKFRNLGDMPLDVTVGRQDVIFGDGWLVLDGTPLDGSRTIYFNAVRGTYNMKDIKTTADLVYMNNKANSDDWVGSFNHRPFPVNNQDEQGAIAYVSNSAIKDTKIDGYFIYKHDDLANGIDSTNSIFAPLKRGDAGDIYTFGNRDEHAFDEHWKARAEIAGQFGEKNDRDLCAFGFNSQVSYAFRDPNSNLLRMSYEHLSGDDPKTKGTDEGFDILWGRWPQWSELYAVTSALDAGRPAQYQNLERVGPGWQFKPCPKGQVDLDYYVLFADENTNGGTASFSQTGLFRGQLATAVFRYTFNEHVSTHVWAEFFAPGDFYSPLRQDVALFLRYELVLTW